MKTTSAGISLGLLTVSLLSCQNRNFNSKNLEFSYQDVAAAEIDLAEFPGMSPNVIGGLESFEYPKSANKVETETGCADLGKFESILDESKAKRILESMKQINARILFSPEDRTFYAQGKIGPSGTQAAPPLTEAIQSLLKPAHDWARTMIQLYNQKHGKTDPIYLRQTSVHWQTDAPGESYTGERRWHKDSESHVRFSLSFLKAGTDYLNYIPKFFAFDPKQHSVTSSKGTPPGNSLFFASGDSRSPGNACWHRQPDFKGDRLFFLVHASSATDSSIRKKVLENRKQPAACETEKSLNLTDSNQSEKNMESAAYCKETSVPAMIDGSGA